MPIDNYATASVRQLREALTALREITDPHAGPEEQG